MSRARLMACTCVAAVVASASSLGSASGAKAAGCPNEAARVGSSSALPDCRAYELVSPADSDGRILGALNTFNTPGDSEAIPADPLSPAPASLAFLSSQSALPEVRGATGVSDFYESVRGANGWQIARRFSPSGSDAVYPLRMGVAPDHLFSVVTVNGGLGSRLAVEGNNATYLGNPDGSFEILGAGDLGVEPYAEATYVGIGGEHIVFSTGHDQTQSVPCNRAGSECEVIQLEPDAPPSGTGAIYDRSADGPTHVISLLPADLSHPNGVPQKAGQEAFYKGTSEDGTAVAFEVEGTLYVRLDDAKTAEAASGSPTFAGLSADGTYLFYVSGGDVHRLDTGAGTTAQVTVTGDAKIVTVSADGSHVYFISETKIGGEGEAGKPNLYVWSGGSTQYVATVVPSDLKQTSGKLNGLPGLTHWTGWVTNPPANGSEQGPGAESSRTTLDGTVLIFESRATLTSYNNTEAGAGACGDPEKAGEGCTEIYRYEDGGPGVTCVSCNPSGSLPTADARLQELQHINSPTIVRNLSTDGSRVFFETAEALAPADVDGINDIYEWEKEEGAGSELALISSGHSVEYPLGIQEAPNIPTPNILLAIGPDGGDVVFITEDALVPGAGEGGSSAIYDARVNGGFPPAAKPTICLVEGCRPPAAGIAPSISGAPSESTHGSGNVKPHRRAHCRHAKRNKSKRHRHCGKQRGSRHRTARLSAAVGSSTGEQAQPLQEDPAAGGAPGNEGPPETGASSANLAAAPAQTAATEDVEYEIESVGAHLSTPVAGMDPYGAGMHPDFTTEFSLNHTIDLNGMPFATDRTEEATISLPPGLLGNPNAIRACKTGELVAANCPVDSQVGVATILAVNQKGGPTEPLYNLVPPHPNEEIARFGFNVASFPIFVDVHVRTASDYGATATVYGPSGFYALVSAKTTLWGNPADPEHDKQRLTQEEVTHYGCSTACKAPGGKRPSGLPPTAFLTNPSACQPMAIGFSFRSYQLPGELFSETAPMDPIDACTGVPFSPSFEATPTSHLAGAPTGLETTLHLPQQSTEAVDTPATATMREARVTLPAGMQIAAGAANWIGTCSDDQVGFHREVDAACPDSSKLGTATIASPDLPEPIEGAVYQRSPRPGHQFGLWLTADALGLHIKIPGELEPDQTTGRLTAVFRDLPQVPVEEIDLDVWGGPRAPLQNPDHCGNFTTDFSFSPHSNDPAASGQSTMQITEGCDQPFSPTLHAGVTDPTAGKFSPFVFDLNREDGQQALRGFSLRLPEGELAKIAGVPLCPDAAAAGGSCPQGSRIGSLQATTGPGPDPLSIPQPGKAQPAIYLSGPYGGAPFSIVSEVPAQAGPFDLGVLAVRSGLDVEPESARAVVKAEPLPQFFKGVGIAYRHLHAVIDRPNFNINPTDCRELAVSADVTSARGTVAHPQARFQVDGCKGLKFKPTLSLKLRGGTRRAAYPALTAVLKARKGDANIAFTSVALPHSEFLAQEHIGTICTRVQFAADNCPRGSVYGKAKAFTPLLGKPLSGAVYLRSSDNPLPDLVAKLGGELEIDLDGRIDSKHGGIRATFESVPDAPVSKFVLQMKGGKKGLLTNSTDICLGKHRATVQMRAQNGRQLGMRPVLVDSNCGRKKR
jgi:hypothetical protein